MSARERVARALFSALRPGGRWEDVPADRLELWGGLADAAIAAMPTERDGLAERAGWLTFRPSPSLSLEPFVGTYFEPELLGLKWRQTVAFDPTKPVLVPIGAQTFRATWTGRYEVGHGDDVAWVYQVEP